MEQPNFVIWKDGKPVAASDPKEAERIAKRVVIIVKVLTEMGFKDATHNNFSEYVSKLAETNFKKYMTFLDRVDVLAKKEGC